MIGLDRYFLVRAAALYFATLAIGAVYLRRRPNRDALAGALLASAWNLPALFLLHIWATSLGWWRYDATGGLLVGMPVDLWLAWAVFWGALPALAAPAVPIVIVITAALVIDIVLMPAAAPVVRLGRAWLIGDVVGVAIVLAPSQLLARWTTSRTHLAGRVLLQMGAFSGLMLLLLPAIVIQGTGSSWSNPLSWSGWALSLAIQGLAIPALLGVTAVQEFASRGGGTPVPFDPPRRLVSTGVYAYVRNPMQLAALLLFVILGVLLRNWWIAAAGVVAHIYSIGLARWDEDQDLSARFGPRWDAYRSRVRAWIPRLRPAFDIEEPPASLFVAASCDMCREVRTWFEARRVRHLAIVPAESHASGRLTRITYEPSDGSPPACGVEAVARALEHIHFGWAMVGFFLRVPGVLQLAQLLADASGAEPRRVMSERLKPVSTGTIFGPADDRVTPDADRCA